MESLQRLEKTKLAKAKPANPKLVKAKLAIATLANAKLANAKLAHAKLAKATLPNTMLPTTTMLAKHCLGSLRRCHTLQLVRRIPCKKWGLNEADPQFGTLIPWGSPADPTRIPTH